MSTIRDVGKMAGVSIATVSRVINKSGYVKQETEKTILQAMQALNYEPDPIARSLAGKSTRTIALVVPDILNPFFPEIAKAVEKEASRLGYTVILCNTDNSLDKEERYFQVFEQKRIDGVILASYTLGAVQIKKWQKKIPIVVIDNRFPQHPTIVSIISHNRTGAHLVVNHLLEQGCRKIAHICGPMGVYSAKERYMGYEDICKDQDWFSPHLIVQGDFQIKESYQATIGLFKRHPDVDGIFAGNDIMAVGALKALVAMGMSVPDEVKLVGFDGISIPLVVPELTTVAQPIGEMGALAMHHLVELIHKRPLASHVQVLDVRLIIKESSTTRASKEFVT
ncbi:LacI family transcriptional regulator [Paenibacillus baekrokdamisoli]|uniref:LacI family transcriptional regulator n=2 Tax=Paenibacillus baekrokdamisoli TaxID=1712516 RepID=A0A3G9JPR6_9BACL|nr:LacI family DNA-binding transcriptional regulator [Paenibacillus baekrokdamisoli]MBB3069394.1 LacI family transcriptional regulator [Paenibacillus baekrokdamisoli]BBH25031.1 LacI family transcriptional regulator [Paenibacillus baekrokdamisoli]BBH25049.1 LacI family transcriptional regulator [Paenibacillus baekrokdamisoli]